MIRLTLLLLLTGCTQAKPEPIEQRLYEDDGWYWVWEDERERWAYYCEDEHAND